MASLGGNLEGNWPTSGWHLVTTGDISVTRNNRGTPQFKQKLVTASGQEAEFQCWITDKSIKFLGRWARDLGMSDAQRAAMDTDNPVSLMPMGNRRCWVLVDWEQSPKNGKWYRRVVEHAPDGAQPLGMPKYQDNPGSVRQGPAAGYAPPAGAYTQTAGSDDIPF